MLWFQETHCGNQWKPLRAGMSGHVILTGSRGECGLCDWLSGLMQCSFPLLELLCVCQHLLVSQDTNSYLQLLRWNVLLHGIQCLSCGECMGRWCLLPVNFYLIVKFQKLSLSHPLQEASPGWTASQVPGWWRPPLPPQPPTRRGTSTGWMRAVRSTRGRETWHPTCGRTSTWWSRGRGSPWYYRARSVGQTHYIIQIHQRTLHLLHINRPNTVVTADKCTRPQPAF